MDTEIELQNTKRQSAAKDDTSLPDLALASIGGTSAMTLFSYLYSNLSGEECREPYLLGKFFTQACNVSERKGRSLGWAMHYLIGFGFVYAGYQLQKKSGKRLFKNSVFLGTMAGLIGVCGWKWLHKAHPWLPITHRKKFYQQLIVAHIVFATVSKNIRLQLQNK